MLAPRCIVFCRQPQLLRKTQHPGNHLATWRSSPPFRARRRPAMPERADHLDIARVHIRKDPGLDCASLREILSSVAREQRGADDEPAGLLVPRRVKRGKEGLGCVSLPPSGAHLPRPRNSLVRFARTRSFAGDRRRPGLFSLSLSLSPPPPTIWTVSPPAEIPVDFPSTFHPSSSLIFLLEDPWSLR